MTIIILKLATDGSIRNGYDYSLQVWVIDGIVVECGHPESMRQHRACCNGWKYHGMSVRSIPGHEIRETDAQITARLTREYQGKYKRNLTP